jgi:hypothetical protein
MNNYVLGSSLTGMIVANILGWPCIGGDLGGRSKAPFPLGPMILEKTEDTDWFLNRLGIKPGSPKRFNVGYLTTGPIGLEPPEGFREAYYKKTRGIDTPSKSSMNRGRSYLEGWDIKAIDLMGKLAEATSTCLINPVAVDSTRNLINGIHGYRRLVSTVPLPRLYGLCGWDEEAVNTFRAFDTQFVYISKSRALRPFMDEMTDKELDFVYCAGDQVFHRVTRLDSDSVVMEVRGDREVPYSLLHGSQYKIYTVKECQIIPNDRTYNCIDGIDLIGRYAQWDHNIKLEDVIRRTRDYAQRQMVNG